MKIIWIILILSVSLLSDGIQLLNIKSDNNKYELDFIFQEPDEYDFNVKIMDQNETLYNESISYENNPIKTSVYFLIDTSTPMKTAFHKGINPLIKSLMLHLNNEKYNVAISGFDKKIYPIKKFNETFQEGLLDELKIEGLRTELYRLSLEAVNELSQHKTVRKVLVLISDGDFEDTAYNVKDLILKAQENQIKILSLGYRESIKIQGIQRPALETDGKLWNANKYTHKMKEGFAEEFLPYLNNGAKISFEKQFPSSINGEKQLLLVINNDHKELKKDFTVKTVKKTEKSLEEKLEEKLAKKEAESINKIQKEIHNENKKDYTTYIILGIVVVLLLVVLLMVLRKKDNENKRIENADVENVNEPIAYLITQSGDKLEIIKEKTSIGRNNDNDIVLNGTYMSGYHADIIYKHGEFFISDKNSTNGIGVNSKAVVSGDGKITQSKLQNNDVIYLGPLELEFKIIK